VAATYYHAHCGGHLASSPHGAYLQAKPDPYCTAKGNDVWQSHFTRAELGRAVGVATVMDLRVTKRTESGRAEAVTYNGKPMHGTTFMNAINRRFGWRVKSLLFDIREQGAGYIITGRGRGHGQGMCQIGAMRMSQTGKSYREILAFYYPGTKLARTAAGLEFQSRRGERIELLTTEPERDGAVLAKAERALDEAQRRTGMTWPGAKPIQVHVYPTVEAFRNSNARGAAVSAVTTGRLVKLMPTASSGVLLHEMIHVVLEANTHRAHPWWFREGFALHLAGERPKDATYESALKRVDELVQRHGRDRVLAYWSEGLPAAERLRSGSGGEGPL
jgi:stage II sporulation protein D